VPCLHVDAESRYRKYFNTPSGVKISRHALHNINYVHRKIVRCRVLGNENILRCFLGTRLDIPGEDGLKIPVFGLPGEALGYQTLGRCLPSVAQPKCWLLALGRRRCA